MKPFLSTPLLESSARENALARYRRARRIQKRIFLPLAIIAAVLFVRCMAIILSH